MTRHDHLDAHLSGPPHHRVKVVDLEPEQHAVPIWPVLGIADPAMMMLDREAVQLKYELSIRDQLFVRRTAVVATAAEESLIPPAARLDVGHGDQRLRTHSIRVSMRASCDPNLVATIKLESDNDRSR